MGFKPSAPVGYDEMLADQNARASTNNYGFGFGSWNPGGEIPDMEYEGEKGNPYFTNLNRPAAQKVTRSTRVPFMWSGDNKSLRSVYEQSYNDYYAGSPSSVSFNNTWSGPTIRPQYSSTGLSAIGTPSYWQDNNDNQVFNTETDDFLPEVSAGSTVAQETASPVAAAVTKPVQTTPQAGLKGMFGAKGIWDMYNAGGEDFQVQSG